MKEEHTFYDIHNHAFNLSHPYLLPFIQRLKIDKLLMFSTIISILWIFGRPITKFVIEKQLNKIKNLLSVMENDIGSFFLLMENCLRETKNPLLQDNGLHIGGKVYTKIVLTPLMMDFGYKSIEDKDIAKDFHYNQPPKKPIREQVVDVFNGIKKYKNASYAKLSKMSEIYPFLGPNTNRIFEIYPFLGLNTKNYDIGRIEKMLDKYFDSYTGSRDALAGNMGKFDGDIEDLTSNFFAGIKVYPPLGFDPWPDKDGEEMELLKVIYLYQYCSDKGIPITVHGSEGGFSALPQKEQKNYTSLSKWRKVLAEYPELKINLAHFPVQEKILGIFPKRKRLKEVLNLVSKYENVYVDFSNRAVNDKYYASLKKLLHKSPDELENRILFGSDLMMCLMSLESYNKYIDIFARNTSLTEEEKNNFCCTNPGRFLFP